MADEKTIIITQNKGEQFSHDHDGGLVLYGAGEQPALQHECGGQVVHTTTKPLVHMICWEEKTCSVEVSANVTLSGDKEAPVEVRMSHHFANDHHQTLRVEPLNHSLKVDTKLAEPMHHALQMRTPLQMSFCNPWHVASDYMVEINLGERRVISVRLTGATVATPQPCEDEPCPPASTHPGP